MKILDLLEEFKNGSYLGVKYSADSCKRLLKFAKDLEIDNIVPKDKLHTTVIYSTKAMPDSFEADGEYEDPIIVQPKELDIFTSDSGARCLVLKLKAPELEKRHKSLMKKHSLKYDFDEYLPHITVSYDVGKEFKVDKNIDLSTLEDLEVSKEYHEQLDSKWKKKLKECLKL